MTPDELKRIRFHSRTMAAQSMIANASAAPADAMRAFAAGLIEGVADTVEAYSDRRAAYDLLQQLADAIGAPLAAQAASEVPL